jgi:dihydrofolate reductase
VIIGIVAIDKNLAIGKDGKLPWHYSADLKFFKETTMGQAIVMGSRTWRSIGKPLTGRTNIVLSRSGNVEAPDEVSVFNEKGSATALAEKLNTDLYVIGGAGIFDEFVYDIDRWIVTEIPMTVDDADTFMPPDFLAGFDLESKRDIGDGLLVSSYTRRSQN